MPKTENTQLMVKQPKDMVNFRFGRTLTPTEMNVFEMVIKFLQGSMTPNIDQAFGVVIKTIRIRPSDITKNRNLTMRKEQTEFFDNLITNKCSFDFFDRRTGQMRRYNLLPITGYICNQDGTVDIILNDVFLAAMLCIKNGYNLYNHHAFLNLKSTGAKLLYLQLCLNANWHKNISLDLQQTREMFRFGENLSARDIHTKLKTYLVSVKKLDPRLETELEKIEERSAKGQKVIKGFVIKVKVERDKTKKMTAKELGYASNVVLLLMNNFGYGKTEAENVVREINSCSDWKFISEKGAYYNKLVREKKCTEEEAKKKIKQILEKEFDLLILT